METDENLQYVTGGSDLMPTHATITHCAFTLRHAGDPAGQKAEMGMYRKTGINSKIKDTKFVEGKRL